MKFVQFCVFHLTSSQCQKVLCTKIRMSNCLFSKSIGIFARSPFSSWDGEVPTPPSILTSRPRTSVLWNILLGRCSSMSSQVWSETLLKSIASAQCSLHCYTLLEISFDCNFPRHTTGSNSGERRPWEDVGAWWLCQHSRFRYRGLHT